MPEAWIQLRLLRAKDEALEKEAERIREACTAAHNKKHIVECPDCYGELLTAIRNRYLRSSDTEWFTGRRAFLAELDALFTEAKDYRIHPDEVDARIQEEKRAWVRENLDTILGSAEDPSAQDAILDRLNDKDASLDGIAGDIDLALRTDEVADAQFDAFVARVSAAQSPDDRIDAYKEMFFVAPGEEPLQPSRQKYIDMLKANKTMDQVLDQVTTDKKAKEAARAQRKDLEDRLNTFQRARAAHGAKMVKKAKAKEDMEKSRIPAEFAHLPPCLVCGEAIELSRGYRCCTVCQLFAGWKVSETTVYCSEKCFRDPIKGQKAHNRKHPCAAGSNCASLHDEDGDMDRQQVVFCKECIDMLKKPTVFCSIKCYEANFQKHRDGVHVPGRAKMSYNRDDAKELEYENADKTKYHARDPRSSVRSWYEAASEWERQFSVDFRTL